uniref:Glutathione S-transferase 1 n=1 Tax=Ascaris lumbricoides TaxID=6252 RepID=A0A0M3HW22_ASCLU
MSQHKLTYFNIRGLGEGARLIFHQAGVEFEDNRLSREDWPSLKPSTPFGQLPLLEVDGEVLAQSTAIFRYLGRKFGLAGKTPMEEAQVDSIFDTYKDFIAEVRPYFLVAGENYPGDKEKLLKELVIPAREKHFPGLEKFLNKSGSGYLVGDSVTWADIVISDSLATWETLVPDLLGNYPVLKKFVEHVRDLPNIKKWIAERPETTI